MAKKITEEKENKNKIDEAPKPKGRVGGKAVEVPQDHGAIHYETEQEIKQLLTADAKAMKERLEKQPRVSFLIPLMPGEKDGAFETVQLNGYKFTIKKGCMVSIPQQVMEVLAEHYQIQVTAGKDKLVDRPFVPTPEKPVPLTQALG